MRKNSKPVKLLKRKPFRQGDVGFVPVDEIPSDARQAKSENGVFVVAHSETGHHHVIEDDGGVAVFDDVKNPLVSYVNASKVFTDLTHKRGNATHGRITFPGNFVDFINIDDAALGSFNIIVCGLQ